MLGIPQWNKKVMNPCHVRCSHIVLLYLFLCYCYVLLIIRVSRRKGWIFHPCSSNYIIDIIDITKYLMNKYKNEQSCLVFCCSHPHTSQHSGPDPPSLSAGLSFRYLLHWGSFLFLASQIASHSNTYSCTLFTRFPGTNRIIMRFLAQSF